jgi:predicted phage tail protein
MQPSIPTVLSYEEAVGGYAAITALYLLGVAAIVLISWAKDLRLIGLGILTAVASIGYSSLVAGGAVLVAPMLMKLGFLLVLGGIVAQLLAVTQRTAELRETEVSP